MVIIFANLSTIDEFSKKIKKKTRGGPVSGFPSPQHFGNILCLY